MKPLDIDLSHPKETVHSRRDFLKQCGTALGTVTLFGIAMPLIQSCEPNSIPIVIEKVDTGGDGFTAINVSSLTQDNTAMVAPGVTGPDGMGVIISRLSATDYRALSMRCTHQGCPVQEPTTQIDCNCHGSQYELTGAVKRGPAPAPLRQYEVSLDRISEGILRVKIK